MQQAISSLLANNISPIILTPMVGLTLDLENEASLTKALISDYTSHDIVQPLPSGLLIAGGVACGNQLLVDPRVHLLVTQMQLETKPVGFLQPVCSPLYKLLSEKKPTQRFFIQERYNSDSFLHTFAQNLHCKNDISANPASSANESMQAMGKQAGHQLGPLFID